MPVQVCCTECPFKAQVLTVDSVRFHTSSFGCWLSVLSNLERWLLMAVNGVRCVGQNEARFEEVPSEHMRLWWTRALRQAHMAQTPRVKTPRAKTPHARRALRRPHASRPHASTPHASRPHTPGAHGADPTRQDKVF
eukprot:356134-Chlamydomonas_euryale.AAC.3